MNPLTLLTIVFVLGWSGFQEVAYGQAVRPGATPSDAQSLGAVDPWPRTAKVGDTELTIYQPQVDKWDGFHLTARAAVGATAGRQGQTRYGVLTFEANTLTDKGRRQVTIEQARVVRADFPSAAAADVKAWQEAVRRGLEGRSRTLSLDQLEAALEVVGVQRPVQQQPLRHVPPHFIFSAVPAVLVSVDGKPVFRVVKGTGLERVVNTRPLLLRDGRGVHYLKIFDGWMSAPAIGGPWTVARSSTELDNAFRQTSSANLIDPLMGQGGNDSPAPKLASIAPAIYVATSPTELIVSEGPPRYTPLGTTHLLYADNTTGNLFRNTADNRIYVLVTGRWFRSSGTDGPWEYVAANALPADFASIPDDSAKENVKVSVAGTPQAREAVIAASIPQTAAVSISTAKMTPPNIDGEPAWRMIPDTSLRYVSNTSIPVIAVGSEGYYAVQNGVWFTAPSLGGPWRVASMVPSSIYTIPPTSPMYYVTYVHVYGTGNGVVYVGYLPGYQGTVIDPGTGVVVYGTGYVYDPWVGTVWYGTPVTYGYAATVAYTPWTGWAVAFGLGWAWGAATAGWGWGPYPYWGPWAYPAWGTAYGARGGAVSWGPRGWAGYTGNIYSQWGNRATVSRATRGYDAWSGNAWAGRAGTSYNSRTGIASAGQRGAVHNVYTGQYAAGASGVARGPGGTVAAGQRGVVGNQATRVAAAGSRGTIVNPNTGQSASAARGVVANRNTGQAESYARVTGAQGGTVARVGNDVYAGRDGNVYRNTGSGWEQHTDGGWTPAAPKPDATRPEAREQRASQLDGERTARQTGEMRTQNLNRSTTGMQHSFGGLRGGGRRR